MSAGKGLLETGQWLVDDENTSMRSQADQRFTTRTGRNGYEPAGLHVVGEGTVNSYLSVSTFRRLLAILICLALLPLVPGGWSEKVTQSAHVSVSSPRSVSRTPPTDVLPERSLANGARFGESKAVVPRRASGAIEYTVNHTTFFTNGTQITGNSNLYPGDYPLLMTYDGINDRIYIADSTLGLFFLNLSSPGRRSFLSVPARWGNVAVTYDTADNQLYMLDQTTNLTGVDPATGKITLHVRVGYDPVSVTPDPATGNLYTVSYASQTTGMINVVDPSTASVIASIAVGDQVSFIAYDPVSHAMVLLREGDNEISAINDTTEQIVATVSVGNLPDGIAFDPLDRTLWVANGDGNNIAILNASTYSLEDRIYNVTDAGSLAFDPEAGVMLVGQGIWQPICCTVFPSNGLHQVSVINATNWGVTRVLNTSSTINDLVAIPATNMVAGLDFINQSIYLWNATTFAQKLETPLNTEPQGIASIPGSPFEMVAESESNELAEVSATTGIPTANISTAPSPYDVAYDSVHDTLWVSDKATGEITPVNLSTGTTLPSVPVGGEPQGVAIDPVSQEVYVAVLGSGRVFAISLKNNSVAGSVAIGNGPVSTIYDPLTGDILATESGSGRLAVIDPANHTVIDQIGLGSTTQPWAAVYDPATHDIYVANNFPNNITIINATTYRTAGSLPAGTGSVAIALDGATGDLLVAESTGPETPGYLSVVDPGMGTLLQEVPVGTDPEGVMYDSSTGSIFVTDRGTNSLSVMGIVPRLVLSSFTASPGTVNTGQSINFTVATTGGAAPLNFSYEGLPAGCVSIDLPHLLCTPSSAGYFNVTAFVGDAGGVLLHARVMIHVLSVFFLKDFIAHPSVLDLGQTTTLYANVSYGTPAYTYNYSGLPSGCPSVNASMVNCTPTVTGNFTVQVNVSDAAGTRVQGQVHIVIHPPLKVIGFSATPSSLLMGNSTVLTTSVAGGTGSDGYVYTGLPPGCGTLNLTAMTCVPTGIGNFTLTVTVIDTLGQHSTATTLLKVSKGAVPFIATLTISQVSFDLGNRTYLNLTIAGGRPPYTVSYNSLPSGCVSANSTALPCTPDAVGSYGPISATVTDLNGSQIQSNRVNLTVHPLPTVSSFTVLPGLIYIGNHTDINVSVSGGVSPYRYVYTGLPSGCASMDTASLLCIPTVPGYYQISVTITDQQGRSATSSPVDLSVDSSPGSLLITAVTANPNPVVVGQRTEISITVSGGTPPYTFHYLGLPPGCGSVDANPVNCTSTSPGNYTLTVSVHDASGKVANATLFLVVKGAISPLSVTLTTNLTVVQVGHPFTLSADVIGGVGPFTYEWSLNGTNLTGSVDSPILSTNRSSPGAYSYSVWVRDSMGELVRGGPVLVEVTLTPPLRLTAVMISPTNATLDQGASQGFSAFVTCSPSPCPSGVVYRWSISPLDLGQLNSTGGSAVELEAGNQSGYGTLTVTATVDSSVMSTAVNVTVEPEPSHGTGAWFGLPITYWVVSGVIILAVVASALVIIRHRARRNTGPTTEGEGEVGRYQPPEYHSDPSNRGSP